MTRPALVVQHDHDEVAGPLRAALESVGVPSDVWVMLDGVPVPDDAAAFSAVVMMGGLQAAYSDLRFPTRRAELELIEHTVDAGIPILGLCLGAQLMAHALGGEAMKGHGPEVGWVPVRLLSSAHDDPLLSGLPDEFAALQWHGDTYRPPPGAVLLAESDAYPNQGFRLGDRAWGLQFHLEAVETIAQTWADSDPVSAGFAPGGADGLRFANRVSYPGSAERRDAVFARFAALVAANEAQSVP
ncbi:MAG: Methyltransferase type 11 [Actinomycetia bacterium]|nr:Methyltransferase type 11 [Actinomycetes bacterium]